MSPRSDLWWPWVLENLTPLYDCKVFLSVRKDLVTFTNCNINGRGHGGALLFYTFHFIFRFSFDRKERHQVYSSQ